MWQAPYTITDDLVRIAYKKLKSSVYYDKSQAPLRDAIVAFESPKVFEKKLKDLSSALKASDEFWKTYSQRSIDTIDFYMLPKSVSARKYDNLILNYDDTLPEITKYQYYINLDIPGHIIGVLWLLTVGKMIDDDTYEHAYGNRLNKHLLNENGEVSLSPTLFEPYIAQYGSWRDRALRIAEKHLDEKEDIFILTLDFQSYFYSVDINKEAFDRLLADYIDTITDADCRWIERIHSFVWQVLERYTKVLQKHKVILETHQNKPDGTEILSRSISQEINHLLPIGFLPCNVLSNWVLRGFDDAISNRWNPLYYGRYVDDIIIVDKVEKNSSLYKSVRAKRPDQYNALTADAIVRRFMCNCRNLETETSCTEGILESLENPTRYRINNNILGHMGSMIDVQPTKLKVFYFRSGTSKALLTRFREDIAKNASEFRVLPELDDALEFGNYSSIIGLKRDDTINKLRGITNVSVDRFELSKFLGKYSVVSTMVDEPKHSAFERDLLSIFDDSTILSNYTLWERVFEILVISGNWTGYTEFAIKIIETIQKLQKIALGQPIDSNMKVCIRSLNCFLSASIRRTSALCWSKRVTTILDKLQKRMHCPEPAGMPIEKNSLRYAYLETRMVNKSVIPILLDFIDLEKLKKDNSASLNLTNLRSAMQFCLEQRVTPIDQYPYWVKPQDLAFSYLCQQISHSRNVEGDYTINEEIEKKYWCFNYQVSSNKDDDGRMVKAVVRRGPNEKDANNEKRQEVIHILSSAKEDLRVAIGNARVNPQDFEDSLRNKRTRSFARYQQMTHIIDEAIRERCDLLVLPELYMPFEWLPVIAKKCASEQIAIVTGLDFIIGGNGGSNSPVYNLTATILPYECDHQKHAYISYHHKVHYSPAEQDLIRKYGFALKTGTTYQLYSWHDVWFSVYCCFELACIQDRALFSSLSDMTIGIEWNKDTSYFDHISSSLARDLHCYVIEANTSQYGGSGVIQPQSSVSSELIRTKGGDNYSILTTSIDIHALREAQYPVISDRKPFKPLPPICNREYITARYNGTLWDILQKEHL